MTKRITISLAARNALVYFVLFTIAISFSAWLLISYSYKEVLELTESRLDHTSEMVDVKFDSYFSNIETDIDQLSNSPLLYRFVVSPDSANLELLASEYQSLLRSKQNYFQIRLISISDYGKELIKIERTGTAIFKTPQSELQNKGNRDYFKELIALPVDSLYVSKIDLNREFGKVSQPRIPTVRMGKKMKGGALNDFIIIININIQKLLDNLVKTLPQNDQLRIVNQDGHFILHPDPAKEFTFDYNKTPQFSAEFNQPLNDLKKQSESANSENAMNRFSELDFKRNDYELTAILSAKKTDVLASFYAWRQSVIAISIIIGIIFLTIGFLYMRKQVKELKSITKQMTEFSGNVGPQTLPIERQDEIGELAREFEKMSAVISKSQTEIELARTKAELAHQEKTEFLENMSHEIRNPLQSIIGAIDILNNNQQLPHQESFIQSIQFSGQQLQSLANDILDFKKIKSLEIELEPKWLNLSQFCNNIIKSAQFLAKSKHIDLSYTEQLKSNKSLVLFDPKRLYQILNNLITNALKFTENGGKVNFKVIENEAGYFEFKIADTGCGLNDVQKEKIMNRHHAEGVGAGAGLGLPIVQSLLEIHQSALKIESTVNKGSRFSFLLVLPSKELEKASRNTVPEVENLSEIQNLDLLIIEDDPQIIKWYQHILKQNNLKFLTHPSQLQQVQNMMFDCIISDYNFGRTQLDLPILKPMFQSILKITGQLIIVSGQALNFEDIWISSLLKPLEKEDLFNLLIVHNIPVQEVPNFTSIEKDYDFQPELIQNVLKLMITEWEKDRKSIWDSISANNIAEFEAIVHRLITSVRRLELVNFEKLLDETRQLFHSENAIHNQIQINNTFIFCITKMEEYNLKIR